MSDKNWQAYQHYLRCRAMGFNGMPEYEKRDPIIQRNFQIIDEVVRAVEEKQRMQAMMMAVQGSMASVVAGAKKKP